MAERVGVIGATGQIGRALTKLLEKNNIDYLLGARSLKNEGKNRQLDIFKEEECEAFVEECDCLINCSGPSMITRNIILPFVLEKKKNYIDAFGWVKDQKKLDTNGSVVILNAGSVPGIPGILVNHFKEEYKRITIYSGGVEKGSMSAFADMVLTSTNGYSKPNFYLKNGELVNKQESSKKVEIKGRKMEAALLCTDEIISVGKADAELEIENYTLWPDERLKQAILLGCISARGKNSWEELRDSMAKAFSKIEEITEGQENWYQISCHCEDDFGSMKVEIETDNSALLTASMIFHTYEKIEGCNPGYYWPYEIVDFEQYMDELEKLGIFVDIHGEL